MTSVFEGAKNRVVEIEIDGDKINVKPKSKDAEMFLVMKETMGDKDVERVTKIMNNIICRANPDDDPEDVADYVGLHYGSIFKRLSVLFGFATEKQLKEAMERATQKK